MLVKFRTIRNTDMVCSMDSKEFYCNKVDDENRIRQYRGKLSQYVLVDDVTLAYLKNAWLHEGMRRVKIKRLEENRVNGNATLLGADQKPIMLAKIEYGWSNGKYYDDKGTLCVIVESDDGFVKAYAYTTVQFIPYEMEEQK